MTVEPELAQPGPLRVVMAMARYPPFSGGVERHVDEVTRRLAARGAEVTVLTTDVSGNLPARESRAGVEVRRFPAWPRKRDYYFSPHIYAAIVRGGWDVVHVQNFQTFVAPLAMLAALRRGSPYVVTFHRGGHSSRLRAAITPVQLRLLGPLLRRAAALVVLSEDERATLATRLKIPPDRFALIPNGSDLPRTAAVASAVRDPDLIASPGRLERYKGHDRVIAALPHILARRPGARLWIAGVGEEESSLRALAEQLGVADRVEIHAIPIDEREHLALALSRVELVVSLSEFETQPIAILEAVGMGCRALVADAPGLRTLARQGIARAIPQSSTPEQIAAAVIEELDRPAATEVVQLPTWDECTDALLELYRAVALQRSGA